MSRKFRNIAFATLATVALATSALTPLAAYAASESDQVVQASKTGTANPNLRLSQDGFNVMRDIRAARVAIFNGDPEAAGTFVKRARDDLAATLKDDTVVKGKGGAEETSSWVPIDGQLVVSDDFVATPEKAAQIAKGNEKIKQGKTDEALEALKLAEVDIGFTRLLMPLDSTAKQITNAQTLLDQHKYYEANMALKAAEDGLNVETVMLVQPTKSGKTGDQQQQQQTKTNSPS